MKSTNRKSEPHVPPDAKAVMRRTRSVEECLAYLRSHPLDLDRDPSFLADFAKALFIEDVLRAMEETGMNKNQLAQKLGKSRQYVGRVLNESANFTVETMAEIACAFGWQFAARMAKPGERISVLPLAPGIRKTVKAKPPTWRFRELARAAKATTEQRATTANKEKRNHRFHRLD